jgi:hypothetical protein
VVLTKFIAKVNDLILSHFTPYLTEQGKLDLRIALCAATRLNN